MTSHSNCATMDREVIKKKLIPLIERITWENDIKDESQFNYDLGFDSLDAVDLIIDTEREFGISIPDEQAEKVKTVKDAIDLIESLVP